MNGSDVGRMPLTEIPRWAVCVVGVVLFAVVAICASALTRGITSEEVLRAGGWHYRK